jgi:hypothetical protein
VPVGIAIAGDQVAAELAVTRHLPRIVAVRQVPGQRLVATAQVGPLADMHDRTPAEPPCVALRRRLGALT